MRGRKGEPSFSSSSAMRSRMQIHYPVRQKGKGCSFKRHAGQDVMLGRSGGDNRRNGGLGTAFLVMGRRKWQTDYLPGRGSRFLPTDPEGANMAVGIPAGTPGGFFIGEKRCPGLQPAAFRQGICGSMPDIEALRHRRQDFLGLGNFVHAGHGSVAPRHFSVRP